MISIPLAVIGVCHGLVVTDTPFSFIVFIGTVSLTCIVVNSGIVMIDSINKKRRVGMPVWSEHDAVAGAMPARILAS